jgi:lipopolysaccharide transport system permease protein
MSADSKAGQILETVYTPESALRSPGKLARSMWHDLLASRELSWRLTVRDVNVRYRQSILGVAWAFLLPLATAGLFVFLNSSGIINVGETGISYVAYALFGTVLWSLFTASLTTPLNVVNSNKALMSQINFPREAIILSAIGQVAFDFCIKLVILIAVFIIYDIQPTWWLLLSPVAMMMLMLLGIMISMILLPLSVLYTDIIHGITAITAIWLFLTPVVYAAPEQGFLSVLMKINPVSYILVGARDLATLGTLPDVMPFAIICCLTILLLLVTWVIYRVSLPILIERMNA